MKLKNSLKPLFTMFLSLVAVLNALAQPSNYVGKKGQLYLSWGYNKEWYTQSNIHIRQEALGNEYSFRNVLAHDKPGWMDDKDNLFQQPITIPQYNARLGYWFKDDWAIEINFDHTKYIVHQEQLLHLKGKINFLPVDTFIINRGNLKWQLNNGANFILFNIVRRIQVPKLQFKNFNVSLLMKGGIGFMTPHVENTILGNNNKPGFQISGWDIGAEAALRFTFFKYAYLEYCNKAIYARYTGLNIYEGTARQAFGCYEMIANIGVNFPIWTAKKKKNSTQENSVPTQNEKIAE